MLFSVRFVCSSLNPKLHFPNINFFFYVGDVCLFVWAKKFITSLVNCFHWAVSSCCIWKDAPLFFCFSWIFQSVKPYFFSFSLFFQNYPSSSLLLLLLFFLSWVLNRIYAILIKVTTFKLNLMIHIWKWISFKILVLT